MNRARLRIALVTPMLPVPHDLTRGRYIHETARCLAKIADVRVYFQTLRYPRLPGIVPKSYLYGDVPPDYKLDGVDVEAFSYGSLPVLGRPLNGWLASRALTPRMATFAPDVVVGYWVYPDGFAALLAAHRLGKPCVVGALGSDIHVRSGSNAWLTRRTIERADALVVVSEAMARGAQAQFGADPARVHTIVNGFNRSVFRLQDQQQARAALGLPMQGRLIVYVGRFVEAKGLIELLDAFEKMAAEDGDVRLALIGDGVMAPQLPGLVRDRGLAERVLLPGSMEPVQVARWISAADLLTLPSWSEGYPNVVVEALACGTPVVATDVGGTREILREDRGLLVSPRDAQALRVALTEALRRPWDRAAIAASMARSWDDVAAETLQVCESVVARRSARRQG
ncbi:glycosyltransferase [Piscinibacter sp.]|uniref:glycosyltransferase n=1 Tax=Piscinibacter sp. TaxID=1903157 RepID=UPI0039E23CD5